MFVFGVHENDYIRAVTCMAKYREYKSVIQYLYSIQIVALNKIPAHNIYTYMNKISAKKTYKCITQYSQLWF